MAEPTKEELELMMRMILGKKYDPDFDPRKLGKREDAYVGSVPSMTAEEVQKLEPGLEGSYPFLSMAGGAKGTRSLLKAIYREAAKAAKPPETVMQVRKGEDYLVPVRERQATKEGIARKQRQRYNLSDDLSDADFTGAYKGIIRGKPLTWEGEESPYAKEKESRRQYGGPTGQGSQMSTSNRMIRRNSQSPMSDQDILDRFGPFSPSTTWETYDPEKHTQYIPPNIDELIKERDLARRAKILPTIRELEKMEAKDVYDPRTDSYMTGGRFLWT